MADKEIKGPFVRSAYNYDRNKASDEAGLACRDASRAKQSFKDECDINTIVRRFGVTGELPTNVRMPTYGDFTGITDFHSAMNAVAKAHESFDAMPAHVRKRFDHDPAKFIEFVNDKDNLEEARKLGLAIPKALEDAKDLAAAAAAAKPPQAPARATPDPASGEKGDNKGVT